MVKIIKKSSFIGTSSFLPDKDMVFSTFHVFLNNILFLKYKGKEIQNNFAIIIWILI